MVSRSSCHGRHPFAVADPVYDLDEGRVCFGVGCHGDGTEDLVGTGNLRWSF